MGLQSQLNDVSSESLPILFLSLLASSFSFLRSLLLSLSLSSFLRLSSPPSLTPTLSFQQPCFQVLLHQEDEDEDEGDSQDKCIVCLSGFKEGDSISKLSCRHVFHKVCLDGWFHQLKFSCPLCRSPLLSDCRLDRAHRRVTRRLVSWLPVR